jgi:hypothetical protein
MAVGGDSLYLVEKNKFAASETPSVVELTLNENDFQLRPADPVDPDKSNTALSHGPTDTGPDIDTTGFVGDDGAETFLAVEGVVSQ